MFFLLIYLLFQCQFLFVEVNGNEEDITIFFPENNAVCSGHYKRN